MTDVIRAGDIMTTDLIVVGPDATIGEIAKLLVENHISGLPVVDENKKVLGIISEGDLLHKEVFPKTPDVLNILGALIYYNGVKAYRQAFRKMMASTAAELMTEKVVTVQESADLSEIGELMLEHHIKRVPVIKDGRLVGMIGRSDIVRLLVE